MRKEKEAGKEEDIEKMSKEELDKISGGTEEPLGFLGIPQGSTSENDTGDLQKSIIKKVTLP